MERHEYERIMRDLAAIAARQEARCGPQGHNIERQEIANPQQVLFNQQQMLFNQQQALFNERLASAIERIDATLAAIRDLLGRDQNGP